MSEINVTPMVDVMLVLLIIFMVSAPLLTVGVPIDLPQTQAKPRQATRSRSRSRSTTKGQVFLQNTEIELDELVPKLKAITQRAAAPTSASMCAATRRSITDGDAGHGTALRGRLPPRRAGDGGRAGPVKLPEMKTRPDHIGARACSAAGCGACRRLPRSRSRPRRRDGTAGRHHLRQPSSRELTKGVKTAPKAETAEAAGREGRRRRSRSRIATPKVADKPEIEAAKADAAAAAAGAQAADAEPQDRAKKEPSRRSTRSPRRLKKEEAEANQSRRQGQGRSRRSKPAPSRSRSSIRTRSRRCSTSATAARRPRPARR